MAILLPYRPDFGSALGQGAAEGMQAGFEKLMQRKEEEEKTLNLAKALEQGLGLNPQQALGYATASRTNPKVLQELLKQQGAQQEAIRQQGYAAEQFAEPEEMPGNLQSVLSTLQPQEMQASTMQPDEQQLQQESEPDIPVEEALPSIKERIATDVKKLVKTPVDRINEIKKEADAERKRLRFQGRRAPTEAARQEIQKRIDAVNDRMDRRIKDVESQEFKTQKEINADTKKTYESINQEKKATKEIIPVLDRMEKLFTQGQPDSREYLNGLEALSKVPIFGKVLEPLGKSFVNADTEELNKLSGQFLNQVRIFFGGNPSEGEVRMLMDTIPNVKQSPQAAMRLINWMRGKQQIADLRHQAMTDIIKANNGKRPANMDILIDEVTEPYIDEINKSLVEKPMQYGSVSTLPGRKEYDEFLQYSMNPETPQSAVQRANPVAKNYILSALQALQNMY